jgi:DNA polymerase III delta prime subunit
MGIENFIKEALYKPNDYIAYHVGRELAELHPGKTIIEGKAGYFDLEAYVRAEKCTIVAESNIFNHVRTFWEKPGKDPTKHIENSWLNVLWRGQLLDVVLITWAEGCYRKRHHWIVAESRKIGEAFFAEVCEWSSEVRGEILVFQDGGWEKNKELYEAIKSSTFDNVILPDALKQQVQNEFEQFFRSREVYGQYGIPWKRGALFLGPPGNGKTHTVKALINQIGRPCLYVKGFKSEYATEQENIGQVFARARLTTPCLLVLEDLDSMIDDGNRSFFLNELDGFESNTGLVVLATTNHPEKLDPAILDRPSRFDRKYHFELPAAAERLAYVAAWNMRLEAELRLSAKGASEVVQRTENFSFAYMKELFVSATMQWMSTNLGPQAARLHGGVTQRQISDEPPPPDHTPGSFGPGAGPAPAKAASMDEIIIDQVIRLRSQMTALSGSSPFPQSLASRGRRLFGAFAAARRIVRRA